MTITAADVKIDPELESYLPILGAQNDSALESSLIDAGGADESIKVWRETGFIVDGHRRFKICRANKLSMKFELLSFQELDDVKLWMLRRQLTRRNLSDVQRAHFDSELYRIAHKDGVSQRAAFKTVAEQTDKSPEAVRRSVEFEQGIAQLPKLVQEKIQSGEVKASMRSVSALNALPDKQRKQVISLIVKGKSRSVSEAIESVSHAANSADGPAESTPKNKVAKADADMPESYVDDLGNPIPEEFFSVWRQRGRFYQLGNEMQRIGGEIVELGESIGCEKTANLAAELCKLRESLLGRQPSVVKGKFWLSRESASK